MTARSRHTEISICMDGIDGTDGKRYYLSNCPYRISRLIRDQEIESPFGSRGNQRDGVGKGTGADHSAVILLSEIDQLLEVMEFII